MYNILALVIGALISIMISFNSGLEGYVGSTYSVVIIHAIGLIAILIEGKNSNKGSYTILLVFRWNFWSYAYFS